MGQSCAISTTMADGILSSENETSSESSESENESESESDVIGIRPHMFEPEASDEETATEHVVEGEDQDLARLTDTSWCTCGYCHIMDNPEDCLCCQECDGTKKEMAAVEAECITKHPGFDALCLNEYTLKTAYRAYRQQYGKLKDKSQKEKYRYIAYRQIVFFCWGWLGKKNRVRIPSCIITAIRTKYSSDSYTGFKPPALD